MRRHKYPKHFCSTCGMSMNSTCRVSVDTTADEFLHRKHVRQKLNGIIFRKNRRVRYERRDVARRKVEKNKRQKSRVNHDRIGIRLEPTYARENRGCLFFYVANEQTPAHTRNYQRSAFLRFRHRDASFRFMFLPLFVYSTFERNRPSFHLRKRTQAGEWEAVDLNFGKGRRRPCISTKDFILVRLEYV